MTADTEAATEDSEPVARVEAGVLHFKGAQFAIPDARAHMAILRYAKLAEKASITDLEAEAAIYDMLEASLAPADWDRFVEVAMKTRATENELLEVIGVVMVELANRPTLRSSDSSRGPRTAEQSSTSTPAERAIAQLAGRPDLQNVVFLADQERAS